MPVYPGAQDLHLQAVEHARRTKANGAETIPRRRNSRQVKVKFD
jgi:hypothetical protein